jgi:mono/diheme cytochrome c family protein
LAAAIASANGAGAQTAVDRGSYLVNTIMACGNCHTPKERGQDVMERAFSGGLHFDEPAFKVTASNITPDRNTGIGSWSDAELKKALTTGIGRNGAPMAEVMPTGFYQILTPGDLDAIVVYLRSLKPIASTMPGPIYKAALPHHVYPGGEKPMAPADLADKVKNGFYLVTIGHCMECHTPGERGANDFKNALGQGGRDFPGPWGVSKSRNITSHKDKGIGAWTDAEIKRTITQGISRDGTRLKPPMGYGYYAKMTEADLDAMVAFLRTVPPKE